MHSPAHVVITARRRIHKSRDCEEARSTRWLGGPKTLNLQRREEKKRIIQTSSTINTNGNPGTHHSSSNGNSVGNSSDAGRRGDKGRSGITDSSSREVESAAEISVSEGGARGRKIGSEGVSSDPSPIKLE
ncbi:hypothetical protein QAD02_003395 [Eretmocerus hayati]|uniref:Uncharacterized protein n=1 Tax=Eretmocerus hayati TaxID=131215 RepID=A0ACC2NMK7_9HYME|nr:hypothetical protein QAD02_003395 [Eretmocerus hayati]